jgi:hypothetical protein
MEIQAHGRRYAVSTNMFEGELLTGRLNREGLRLTCLAKNLVTDSFVESILVQTCDGGNVDAKIIYIDGQIDRTYVCSIDLPLSEIPHPYIAVFNVFAISTEEQIAFLLPRLPLYDLDKISIKTIADFA